MRKLAMVASISLVLTGCGTMAGVGAGSSFGCQAPDGVTCSSLSGVYANAVANNLPGAQKSAHSSTEVLPSKSAVTAISGRALSSGSPLRSTAKVLRIWLAPWEDSENDLHDQSYIYVIADQGRWSIEHNQRQILNNYRPTVTKSGSGKTLSQPNASQKPQGSLLPTGAGAIETSSGRLQDSLQ